MMDTIVNSSAKQSIELLRSRRSVVAKNMSEPGPTSEELELILEAGIRVPDHGKIGPWRLQVLDKSAQAMLGDVLANEFKARIPDANDAQIEFERLRPQRAPTLIVVSSNVNKEHSVPEFEQLLSCGAVCMNLLNAAAALGYAAQWLTEWPAYNNNVKHALGVTGDQHIVGLMYFGTAVEPPSERVRPDAGTVVSYPDAIPLT
ncbi:nitroreductase [Pelagibius sp. Alg239-R121]|uniref:nitroreductase family protein n=1 Tax=Pelagibius sp. Alg239-R121 TaxID=2993448 RepID=UPI002AC34C24|nr:nitroreductase [Pelagibius sp. Alg239-R121]